MDLSIIVPVYRRKAIIEELIKRIHNTLINKFEYEILLICDDCDFVTTSVIKKIKSFNLDQIKVYYFAKNYGQQRAIQFGFTKASGHFIITIDEDLQHDPSDILRLIQKQNEGSFDIVYGKFTNNRHAGRRKVLSAYLRKILKIFIPTLYEDYSPYRLIRRDIAIRTSTMVCPFTFIDDFLSRITQNIGFIDVDQHKRFSGKSSYTFLKFIKLGIFY